MNLEEIQAKTSEFVKNLINNSKEENGKGEVIDNDKTDKRKLIDEVAGIMKSGGCDDELIRTAIGKMEKIGYDKSETGKADNDTSDSKKGKKDDDGNVKNETPKSDEEVKDLKKDVKQDVDNKCNNAVDNAKTDFYGKMNEIYNSSIQHKEESTYISRADRLKAGEEYFA